MGGNVATLKIDLEVDGKGGVKVIRQVGEESEKAGKKSKKGFDQMASGARSAGAGIGKLVAAGAGILGLGLAYNKLKRAAAEWVDLAGVQEGAEAKLGATIRATGGAAGYTLGELKAMAGGMQALTTTGDEVTLSGMAVLTTFKQIRGEGFQRATAAAIDMQAVMGGPLQSSITMVGKALNDPIANLSAMSRAGVQFTAEQKEMIKALWEAGEAEKAQGIILAELEGQFGGTAAALRNTFAGSVTAAGNALGDMKEEAGFVITKNQFLVDLVKMAEQQFVRWGAAIADNREYLMNLTKGGVLYLADGIGFAVETMRFFHNGWLGIKLVGTTAVSAISVALEGLLGALRIVLAPLDGIFNGLQRMGAIDVNPFDSLAEGVGNFRASSIDVTKGVLADIEKTNAAYDQVGITIQSARDEIAKIPVAQEKATVATVAAAAQTVKQIEKTSKAEKKAIDQARKMREDFSEKYQKLSLGDYKFARAQLVAQANAYKEAGADELQVARWLSAALRKLDEKQTRTAAAEQEKQVRAAEQAAREKTLASNDFFAGMAIGWQDLTDDTLTWAEVGRGAVEEFADSASAEMSGFINPLSDEFANLGNAVQGVFEDMANYAADAVSKMAVDWAIAEGLDFLGSLWPTSHTGTWDVAGVSSDELGVIVQRGQMIVPKGESQQIREAMRSIGSDNFGDVVSAVQAGTASTEMERALGAVAGTYGLAATAGTIGVARSTIDIDQLMDFMASPNLAQKASGAGALGFAKSALGITVDMPTQAAGWFGGTVGGLALGPYGALVGNLLGSYAMELGMDAANARLNEPIQDLYEEVMSRSDVKALMKEMMPYRQWDITKWGTLRQNYGFGTPAAWGGMDPRGGESTGSGAGTGGGRGGEHETTSDAAGGIGGLAYGGPTMPGSIYEILERGEPEVYSAGGRHYLLSGDEPGRVTPVDGKERGRAAAPTLVIQGPLVSIEGDFRGSEEEYEKLQRGVKQALQELNIYTPGIDL